MPWQNPAGQAVQRRLEAVIQDLGPNSPGITSNAKFETSGRSMVIPLDCSSPVPCSIEPYALSPSPPLGLRTTATAQTNCNNNSMDTAMQCIGAAVESLVEGAALANVVGTKKQSTADATAQIAWYEPLPPKLRTSQPAPKDVSFVRKDSNGTSHSAACTSTCPPAMPLTGPGGRIASWKAVGAEPHAQLCSFNSEEQLETTCRLKALGVLHNQTPEGQSTSPHHCNSQCSSPLGTDWAASPSCWYVLGRLCAWRCFLAAPLAAVAFAVTAGARRWGSWEQVEPGVQVMSLASWLQCCWFVMSHDGRRITTRLAQLAAAGLGLLLVLMTLCPDICGSQLQPGALDEQVDGGLMGPELAALWGALASAVVSRQVGAAAVEQQKTGYESLEDAERRRSSARLQAALASLLAMWLLQLLAASLTLPPAVTAPPHHSPLLLASLKSHADLVSLYSEETRHLNEGYMTSLTHGSEDPPRSTAATKGGWVGESRCCCCTAVSPPSHRHLALGLQPGPVLRGPAQVAQWALLVGAVAAQCAVAVKMVELRRPVLERLQLSIGTVTNSIPMPTSVASSSARIQPLSCWPALGVLALAMSAPLPLPSLLSAAAAAPTSLRARLLLHPALLQLRPIGAAGRQLLGLHLADRHVARLVTALAVGVLLGPAAGAFTWQLLQVATVVVGMATLWLTGIRRGNSSPRVAQQQHIPDGEGGVYSSVGATAGSGMGIGADCTQPNGGIAGACTSASTTAAAASASGRAVSFSEAPGAANCAASGRTACESAAATIGRAGRWRIGGREGDIPVSDMGCWRVGGADGSGPDGPLTSPSCGPGCTGGGSCSGGPTLPSPCSSGRSLGSGGGTSGSTDPGAVYCGGGGGVNPASSNWSAGALFARRPPPLAPVSEPLDPHYLALDSSHQHHHRHGITTDGFATQTPSPAFQPISPGGRAKLPGGRSSVTPHTSCLVTSRLVHWRSCACTAIMPWNVLTGSLGTLTALLWLVLMAPPLAILGDGPADVFEVLMRTVPGSVFLLALMGGAVCAGLLAAGCLLWCAVTGELWWRGRSDAWECRRLECLVWAGGPQVLVAAFSALSWALGEEHNTGAFLVAEALRLAALWPLVWLLEPWLLRPGRVANPIGGCMHHAGCGVTCCVLRWCGLRSSIPALSGGRRDVVPVWDCEGQAAGRWSSGRRGPKGTTLRVEVN